jgi:GTP 3',8-cyclase
MVEKKLYNENKLIKHLDRLNAWEKGELFYPVLVDFDLTDKCNNRCPLCSGDFRKQGTTFVEIDRGKNIITDLGKLGIKGVAFGGVNGDPSCHPDLAMFIEFVKKNGMDVALTTNGFQLSDEIIKSSVKNCTWIRISLDADCPDTYKKTHGMKPGDFYQTVNNIRRLANAKKEFGGDVTIGVSYLLGKHTISGAYNATKLCKEIGVDHIRFRPFFIFKDKNIFNYGDSKIFLKEMEKCKSLEDDNFKVSYSEERCEALGGCKKREFYECFVSNFITFISSDLKVYVCCLLKDNKKYCLGDLKEKSFDEIWSSENRKKIIKSVNLACNCAYPCMHEKHNEFLWNLKQPILHKNFL